MNCSLASCVLPTVYCEIVCKFRLRNVLNGTWEKLSELNSVLRVQVIFFGFYTNLFYNLFEKLSSFYYINAVMELLLVMLVYQ